MWLRAGVWAGCGASPPEPCFLAAGMTNHEATQKVDAGYRMPCPPMCPPAMHRLMLSCWQADPGARPCFQAIQERLCSLTRYENPL